MLGKMRLARRPWPAGFTLIEMMVVIAIITILASIAVPSFNSLFDRSRLRGAADALFGDLQFARMEAIRNNQVVFVNFKTGSSWCYGMKVGSACDCSQPSTDANYCSLKLANAGGNAGVTLSSTTFSADPSFDPVQGLATQAGSATFTSTGSAQAQIGLSLLGTVSLCTPSGAISAGYSAC